MNMPVKKCPSCGVKPGELHKGMCDVERCPYCGMQYISCECCEEDPPNNKRLPWTGIWPGVAECQEFGWYSYLRGGWGNPTGWQRCGKGEHPDAVEDLNRLVTEACWDSKKRRWVLPDNA